MPKEKLIRDRIPERAAARGDALNIRVASPGEARILLIAKVQEELAEFAENPTAEEAADVYTAVLALFKEHHLSFAGAVWPHVRAKLVSHGGFNDRLVLVIEE